MRKRQTQKEKSIEYIKKHPAYKYAEWAGNPENPDTPKYIKLQCVDFLITANGQNEVYTLNVSLMRCIDNVLSLMIMPTGFQSGATIKEAMLGFQWLFLVAILCTVHRSDPQKRRYQTAVLEICRKNGKTFLIAILFIILMLTEPQSSQFFSVAPDGTLSKQVQQAVEEILRGSPAVQLNPNGTDRFKTQRDRIICTLNHNVFTPLNYSRNRMDGRNPSVFLADEVGALPNNYPIYAMRSGQLHVKNKLGCIISTKYPDFNNPMEEEIEAAKRMLDGITEDPTVFALLYEPDISKGWETNDHIIKQSNPMAVDLDYIFGAIKEKRERAVSTESTRQNFLTKHCNIMYTGSPAESYVNITDKYYKNITNIKNIAIYLILVKI